MANIFKRNGSPYWYARFQLNGQRYCRSTGETGKAKAQEQLARLLSDAKSSESIESTGIKLLEEFSNLSVDIALERKLALCRQILNSVSPEEARGEQEVEAIFQCGLHLLRNLPSPAQSRIKNDIRKQLGSIGDAKVAIDDAWSEWLHNPKKKNPGERTIDGYQSHWIRFLSWLNQEFTDLVFLHEISESTAEQYAKNLWASNVSPSTYNKHIKFLQGMFSVLSTTAGLGVNPWAKIPAMKSQQESKRELTPEELRRVCGTAEGDMRYWFAIGLYTGLRLGDVVTLKWSEIDLKNGVINRVPSKTKRTNKSVQIPIHPVLDSLLTELKSNGSTGDALFPESAKRYGNDPASISKRIQKHFQSNDIITTEKSDSKHRKRAVIRVGFHSLRHSFVSLCAANRVPEVAIMEMVGHGSPAMTRLYSHAGSEQKVSAIAGLPKISF
ncbi:MAG: site-specific integrase [Verrucomicrobiota bacterium]